MHKILLLGAVAISVLFGAIEANASNPNVLPSSPYAIMRDGAQVEGRAAYSEVPSTADLHAYYAQSIDNFVGAAKNYRGRIVRNAGACEPDVASAVWGGDASLLGYSCHREAAN
jgi:hypothetical protein